MHMVPYFVHHPYHSYYEENLYFHYCHVTLPEMEEKLTKFLETHDMKYPIAASGKAFEDHDLRKSVLTCLNQLASYWIRQKSSRNIDQQNLDGTFVRPFGSYGLGLFSPNSDLDAVLIAPQGVERSHFFSSFVELLRQQVEIKDVCPIESTFVPVVKFTYYGMEVDLLFATLRCSSIPDDARLLCNDFLAYLDDKSKLSINGWRVSQTILKLVPDLNLFRMVLALVKHWASQRLIYSNTLGYLGGVSWAILVAYVCRNTTKTSVYQVVKEFFETFAEWKWPNPVILTYLTGNETHSPDYVMPIWTPCYPCQNSSFNVTRTTLKNIRNEMTRAVKIIQKMEKKSFSAWEELVEARCPINEYEFFLTVTGYAENDGGLKRWRGVVEARLRQVLTHLEAISGVCRVQIFPRTYTSTKMADQIHCVWLIGIDHPQGPKAATEVVQAFMRNIEFHKQQCGLVHERVQVKGHNNCRIRYLLVL